MSKINASEQEPVKPNDNRRLLHFTMKITDRLKTKEFFCNILRMKILRHYEMEFGCEAKCNGDFESPWSKTMIGYGDEKSYFVFELNYNYNINNYTYGNDYSSVTIHNRQAVYNARQYLEKKFIESDTQQSIIIRSPDNHRFILIDKDVENGYDPVQYLSLNVSNLQISLEYYTHLLEMKINQEESNENHVKLYYGSMTNQHLQRINANGFLFDRQCQLELIQVNQPIERGEGYGRIAFSCPTDEIDSIEDLINKNNRVVLIPRMELGDPSDPNQEVVVILSDPDQHEICFVGEENYSINCQTDPNAEKKFYDGLQNKPHENESVSDN